MGHGRDGGARAPASGARRGALPDLGSQRRRVARPRDCPSRPTGCFRSCDGRTSARCPCFVKPLTRRALRASELARRPQPPRVGADAAGREDRRAQLAARRRSAADPAVRRQVHRRLWKQLAPKFDLAVRRDAAYLNWKYVSARRTSATRIAALRRDDRNVGYAVYRHLHEPRGRVTLLVDFLVDPDDESGLRTLLGWVDREARQADSDKIRAFAMHGAFRRVLRRSGYFQVKSTHGVRRQGQRRRGAALVLRARPTDWHITLGDSDQDR